MYINHCPAFWTISDKCAAVNRSSNKILEPEGLLFLLLTTLNNDNKSRVLNFSFSYVNFAFNCFSEEILQDNFKENISF